MKTYYSIVSVAPKSYLNERFNVGLLCVTPEETFFHFSEAKFKIVSKLLSTTGVKLAFFALEGIKQTLHVTEINNELSFSNSSFSLVSESYLNYLHRYNNNLIQFTEPVQIDIDVNREVFEILFKKYIFSSEIFESITKPEKSIFLKVSKQLLAQAKTYASIHFSVNSSVVPELAVPVTVDIFGKNGSFVASQLIDFKKQKHSLIGEISSYLYLVEKTNRSDSKSKSFIIGDEPSKNDKEHHQIYKDLYQANLVEIISLNESERIIDYMKEQGVGPISL